MSAAHKLYEKHSQDELVAMQEAICADPASKAQSGQLRIYTAAASKRLDAIAQAITWKLEDKRRTQGNLVPTSGYSGRNSNK